MKMTVVHNPTAYDIPIATITMPKITSDMVIQMTDFSSFTRSNIDALQKEQLFISPGVNGFGTLDHDNVMLTDSFAYDEVRARHIPLWYEHTISGAIRSTNYTDYTMLIPARGEGDTAPVNIQIPQILTADTVLVEDSVRFLSSLQGGIQLPTDAETGAYGITVESTRFSVDYVRGIITMSPQTTDYILSYRIVTVDISVEIPDGYVYRLSARMHPVSGCDYFVVSIHSNYRYPLRVHFNRIDRISGSDHTEYTQIHELWKQLAPAVVTTTTMPNDERFYCIDELKVYLLRRNAKYGQFAIASRWSETGLVRVDVPRNRSFSECWNLQCKCRRHLRRVKSEVTVIDRTHIKLQDGDVYVARNGDGDIINIAIYRSNGERLTATDCDARYGVVTSAQSVSMKEIIYAEYECYCDYVDIAPICMNPYHDHYQGLNDPFGLLFTPHDKRIKSLGVFLLNGELCVGMFDRVKNGNVISYTYNDLMIAVTTTNLKLYKYTNGAFSAIENKTGVIPIAMLYLATPIDETAIAVEDARIYGGGTLQTFHNQYDRAYYDGEITDMSSHVTVKVAAEVYRGLVDANLAHDPAMYLTETPQDLAESDARATIKQAAEKAALAGTVKEISIG